jgi:hypothetical protein
MQARKPFPCPVTEGNIIPEVNSENLHALLAAVTSRNEHNDKKQTRFGRKTPFPGVLISLNAWYLVILYMCWKLVFIITVIRFISNVTYFEFDHTAAINR